MDSGECPFKRLKLDETVNDESPPVPEGKSESPSEPTEAINDVDMVTNGNGDESGTEDEEEGK